MEAEDVLHDAFIQIFKSIQSFRMDGPLGAWMRKITVNKALEYLRKNKLRAAHLKDFSLVVETTVIDDQAIEKLELEDLYGMIKQLSTGFRTVFNLYAIEGYNHREIGELLGISENTSKTQYSRARIALRKMIEKEYCQNITSKANGI
jgi:RNA polymerase sigma-70 factor (ECF subfamily)